ncbi:hypothetical protein [Streptomyces thermospinosisporus]
MAAAVPVVNFARDLAVAITPHNVTSGRGFPFTSGFPGRLPA